MAVTHNIFLKGFNQSEEYLNDPDLTSGMLDRQFYGMAGQDFYKRKKQELLRAFPELGCHESISSGFPCIKIDSSVCNNLELYAAHEAVECVDPVTSENGGQG